MHPHLISTLLLAVSVAAACGGGETAPPPVPASPPPVEVAITRPPAEREASSLALCIVLDRSGSMTGAPLEMAKAAATQTAQQILDSESLEVIAFDSRPDRAAKMRSGRERGSLVEDIARIQPGGGTEIFSALSAAYEDLSTMSAPRKHVILLTDGMAPIQGIRELVKKMASEKVTTSSISLGTNTDEPLLQEIATMGSGRFHRVLDPADLPAVFKAELAAARKEPSR